MGDPINYFSGGSGVKHLSASEIAKMKKNMKKVPVIQLQSDVYHEKEVDTAEKMLGDAIIKDDIDDKLDDTEKNISLTPHHKTTFRQRVTLRLQKLFTSHT